MKNKWIFCIALFAFCFCSSSYRTGKSSRDCQRQEIYEYLKKEQVKFQMKCANDSCHELLDKTKREMIIAKIDTFYKKHTISYRKVNEIITDGKDYLIRIYENKYSNQICDSLRNAWYDTLPESFRKADSINKSVGYLIEMPMPKIPNEICKECGYKIGRASC